MNETKAYGPSQQALVAAADEYGVASAQARHRFYVALDAAHDPRIERYLAAQEKRAEELDELEDVEVREHLRRLQQQRDRDERT